MEQNKNTSTIIVDGKTTEPAIISPETAKRTFFSLRASKPSPKFVIALLIINVFTIIGPAILYAYAVIQARNGASGTEFLTLALIPVIPFSVITLLFNVIYLPIYIFASKPSLKLTIPSVFVILISLPVIAATAYSFTRHSDNTPKVSQQSYYQSPTPGFKQIDNATALQALNSCKVNNFIGYTTDIALVHPNAKQGVKLAEKSSNGIIKYSDPDSTITTLYLSKAATAGLLAQAHSARTACLSTTPLNIYIDNTEEVRASDGSWQTVTAPTN